MQQILSNMLQQDKIDQVDPRALLLYNLQMQQQAPQGDLLASNQLTGKGFLEGYPMRYATNYFDGSQDKNILTPKTGAISDARGYEDEDKKNRVDAFNAGYMNLNRQFRGK